MRSFKFILGGTVSLAAIALSAPAHAQDATEDEVIVTGIRSSIEKAVDIKREANSIVDAITAEDIGKFPDKNVAESLQRVPGITVQRQFGEGAAVGIRGAGPDLTLTNLNGQNVASTGWFVLEPARRSFNYELLPSELVGSVEVFKSSQADLSEGGVGGTVIVNTRRPLDMASKSIFASIEGQYQDDSDKIDPQASGLVSWKNENETVGLLLSGVYQKRHLQRQGNEAFWEWGAGPVAFEQERVRTAITGALQFKPSENLDILINAMNMEMEADNTNYALWLTQGNTSWSGLPRPAGDLLNGETAVRGPLNVAFYQARPREATMKSRVFDVDVNYSGDDYDIHLQAGRTESTGGTDFEMVLDDGLVPSISAGSYDFSGGEQTWSLPSGFNPATYDPGSLNMGTGPNFNRTPKEDNETYAQFDITKNVDYGVVDSIKAGVKYADHESSSRRYEFTQAAGFNANTPTAGLTDGTIEAGTGSGSYDLLRLNADAIKDWARASITGETEDLGSFSNIEEKNFAAYVMANFDGDGFRGNLGLRYINTDATSNYFVNGAPTATSASYDEWLPSANLVVDLGEDLILRSSAARAIARPQYIDMYVNPDVRGTFDDLANNQFWIVGNVGLKPFISNQFDMGVEYYFKERSLFSLTGFIKDVKNFVNFTEYQAAAADIPFTLPTTPVNEQAGGWTVQEKFNGKDAEIFGFEAQLMYDFGNGFGTLFNYTYTDTTTDDDTFVDGNPILSDSSKHSLNASVYYENDRFQTRASYNYRSKYMLREVGAYGNRIHDDYGVIDLSASYNVTDNVSLDLDVNNLLPENSRQFGYNVNPSPESGFTRGFPLYEYETARRITLGVSAKF